MADTVRGLLEIEIVEASDLADTDGMFAGASDAYVKVGICRKRLLARLTIIHRI